MKNYIKDNLTVKLFLITCALLISVSLLICGLIAFLMPRSYVQVQNEQLDRDIKSLIAQVENTEFMQAGKLLADFASQQQITFKLYDTTKNLNIRFENSGDYSTSNQQALQKNGSNTISTIILGEETYKNDDFRFAIRTYKDGNSFYEASGRRTDGELHSLTIEGLSTEDEQFDKDFQNFITQLGNTEFTQARKLFEDFASEQQIAIVTKYVYANHSSYGVSGLIIEGKFYSLTAELSTESEQFDKDLEKLIAQVENTDFTQAHKLLADFASQQQIALTLHDTSENLSIIFDNSTAYSTSNQQSLPKNDPNLAINHDYTIVTKYSDTTYGVRGVMIDGEIYSFIVSGLSTENEKLDEDLMSFLAQMESTDFIQRQQLWADFVRQQQVFAGNQQMRLVFYEPTIDHKDSMLIYEYGFGDEYQHANEVMDSTIFDAANAIIGTDADAIVAEISYQVSELIIDEEFYSLRIPDVSPENEQFEKDFQNLIVQVKNTDLTHAKKLVANFASRQQITLKLHEKKGTGSYEIRGLVIEGKFYSLIAELSIENEQLDKDIERLIAQVENTNFAQAHNLLTDFASQKQIALTLHDASESLSVIFDNSTASSESNQETLQTTEAIVTTITETEKAVSESDNIVISITSDADTMMVENSDSSYEVLIEGQIYSLAITGLSTEAVNQITFVLKNILPWIIFFMTGLSFIIAIFSSKLLTKPIQRLNDATKQIAELSFDINCDEKRTDELGQLAKNINFLSSKLNTTLRSLHDEIEHEKMLEEKQRLFFAAASHELKTPLTIIKGNLEGMFYGYEEYQDKDTYISSSLRTTCEMQKLINEILHVSQLDAKGMKLQLETVNVKDLIDSIVENYKEIIELKKFTVVCQLVNVSRHVDKALFIKALQNIIGNAFYYSPDGAKVLITLSENLISVENFGLTLAQSEIEKVFQPFYRVEKSRNRQTGGSGLGLHFVKTILEQHKLVFSMVSKKDSIVFEIQI